MYAIIGYRVSMVRVDTEHPRFNGSSHDTMKEAEAFVEFFKGYGDIISTINPINFRCNHNLGSMVDEYEYRGYRIIHSLSNGNLYIADPNGNTKHFSEKSSIHEAMNYIDRAIFDSNNT